MIRGSTHLALGGTYHRLAQLCGGVCKLHATRSESGSGQKLPPVIYETTAQLLSSHGVDLKKVARRCNSALQCDVANAQAVITTLKKHDINAIKMIESNPRLLRIPVELFDARIVALKGFLGERPKAIANAPTLLGHLSHTLEYKIPLLTSLGLDAKKLIRRYPMVLGHKVQSASVRISFFEETGLDAIGIINGFPHVIGYDIGRKLRPIVEYITKDMGRLLEEINKCPRCFSTSLELRLKPRHEYLMLCGRRQDYSLGVICGSTDAKFVTLTNQTFDHYRQWLLARTS